MINLKAKTNLAIVIGLVLVGLAILLWANQTGRIKIFGEAQKQLVTKTVSARGDWLKGEFKGVRVDNQGRLVLNPVGWVIFDTYICQPQIDLCLLSTNDSWQPSQYTNGIVKMSKDREGVQAVFAYPVVLRENLSEEQIAKDYFQVLKSNLNYDLNLSAGKLENKVYTADLSGKIAGIEIKGKLQSFKLEQAGRNSAKLLFYWAPAAEFAKEEELLAARAQALYQTNVQNKGVELAYHRHGSFNSWYPQDWEINSSSADPNNNQSLDLVAKNKEAVINFAYIVGGQPTDSLEFVKRVLSVLFDNYQEIAQERLGEVTGPLATKWNTSAVEFTGKTIDPGALQGDLHCVATGTSGGILQNFGSGILYIRCAKKDRWDQYNAITQIIQERIQIRNDADNPAKGVNLPRNNPADSSFIMGSYQYRSAVQSNLSSKWQEAIMGYEYANDGVDNYQMPLSAWQDTDPAGGSQGPGYYIWKNEAWKKLTVEEQINLY